MAFSKSQQNYSTTERELSAIRWACENFKPFIFGIEFILYTDHKPLVFMYNMSPHNSRVQRTLEDLAQFNFKIKYLPGRENEAADILSRLEVEEQRQQEEEDCESVGLPKGLKVSEKIEGGGNSMFKAVVSAMQDVFEEEEQLEHMEVRRKAVSEIIAHPAKYKIPNNKVEKKKLKFMLHSDVLPCTEALLAISYIYKLQINVYNNIPVPVVFHANKSDDRVIHLQCISFIHFNPLRAKKSLELEVSDRMVNTIAIEDECGKFDGNNLEVGNIYEEIERIKDCDHEVASNVTEVEYNGKKLCALIDSGSQVSLIGDETWRKVSKGWETVEMENTMLCGMSGESRGCLGMVNLSLKAGNEDCAEFSFAIVKEDLLPCCVLLGINFLCKQSCVMDFHKSNIQIGNVNLPVSMNLYVNADSPFKLGSIEIVEDDDGVRRRFEFLIPDEELVLMQKHDHCINMLRNKVCKEVPYRFWKGALSQFKRCKPVLRMDDGLLVRIDGDKRMAVLSFRSIVEIVYKTHTRLAHLGRQKLLEIVARQFWHPGVEKVVREICRTCSFCQKNKVNVLIEKPPVLKIQSEYPFQLVAIDVVKFPTSYSGFIGALVVVDHFSKWGTAIPIRNKSAATITTALKSQVLPNLVRVPQSILTDNGSEFKNQELDTALADFGIKHLFTSPYSPACNGAVERLNQTLIGIIKSLVDDIADWDKVLTKSLIMYNNTYHSAIKATPSEFLMNNPYNTRNSIPIGIEESETWREGHPNFKPFAVGQEVLKQIERMGNRASYKLMPKYNGPYTIKKVFSNGLSYEIGMEGCDTVRAHHRKLRPFCRLSEALRRFIPEVGGGEEHLEDTTNLQQDFTGLQSGVLTQSSDSEESGFSFSGFDDDESSSTSEDEAGKELSEKMECEVNKNPVELSQLPCSEPVSRDEEEKVESSEPDLHSEPVSGDEEEKVDNPKSTPEDFARSTDVQDEIVVEEKKKQLWSTPINDDRSVSSYFKEFIGDEYVLEQTINYQAEVLELVRYDWNSIDSKLSKIDTFLNKRITTSDEQELNQLAEENYSNLNFSGFSLEDSVKSVSSTIHDLKQIVRIARDDLQKGRSRNEDFRKRIWRYREEKHSFNLTGGDSRIENLSREMGDVVPELPQWSSTPRRVLKSEGKVSDLPNVQSSTLEYCLKKLKL